MVLVKLFFIYKKWILTAFRECPYGHVERPTLDRFSYVRERRAGLSNLSGVTSRPLHPRSRGAMAFIPIYPNALNCLPKPSRVSRTPPVLSLT